MIDTHAHLNFKAFASDVSLVVRRFLEKGGEYLNIVGAKIDSSWQAINLAKKHSCCYATIGIHPHHVNTVNNLTKTYEELTSFIKPSNKIIAIGETGLDYHHYKNSPSPDRTIKNKQKELFLFQLTLASWQKLPVVIHCRKAYTDLLAMLVKFMKSHCLTGVFHCFQGDDYYLKKILSLGFLVGFDGNITYPENQVLRDLVKKTPLTSLVLETDSPFLTPLPYRGQRNEPAYLSYLVKAIAEIKNIKEKQVVNQTSQNAKTLFAFAKIKR